MCVTWNVVLKGALDMHTGALNKYIFLYKNLCFMQWIYNSHANIKYPDYNYYSM